MTHSDFDIGLHLPQLLPHSLSDGSDCVLCGGVEMSLGHTMPSNTVATDDTLNIAKPCDLEITS